MIQLQESEIQKLSSITEIPTMVLQKLLLMGLIDEERALDMLILYDFRRIKRRGLYKIGQIAEAMAEKYNVNRNRVNKAVRGRKTKKRYFCDGCGKEITKREKNKGAGLCAHCVTLNIITN